MPSKIFCYCGQCRPLAKISASWDAVGTQTSYLAILDYLVGEMLPDVIVLSSLPSANDIVTPLDAQ